MCAEHLRPLLDRESDVMAITMFANSFARGQIPSDVVAAVRLGRMTALQKPDGGVRGIVVGDYFRRLVSRTLAKQFAQKAEDATSPFQYALKTRAGCECVAHMVQASTEFSDSATIVSVDGVGAYDLVSRTAMLRGLMDMEEGDKLLPFVRLFYSDPSTFLWDDEVGDTQGEGGEQGDALMPLLFSLGQHGALKAVARSLEEGERLFAFLDDLYVLCRPDRVQAVHRTMVQELWDHARISLHNGKTKVWNRGGIAPSGWSNLQQMASKEDPDAVVWRGDTFLPTSRQGLLILGTPVGHDFVKEQLLIRREKHDVLLQRIPAVPHLQAAWLLLTFFAAARANFTLRTVRPALVEEFAASHNHAIWTCLVKILGIDGSAVSEAAKKAVTLPLSTGGLGIQDATRAIPAAQWASWADALEMIRKRHPGVAAEIITALDQGHSSPSITAVRDSKECLEAAGFEMPSWETLAKGARPNRPNPEEEIVDTVANQGWQRPASVVLEKNSLDELRRQLTEPERALMLSQGGPMAAEPFSSFPTSRETRFDSQPFRVLLLRRLRLPLPLTACRCRCGRLLDVFGHHRAACATVGVLGRRGFALESAAARVCREAGGRVRTNVLVRELDLHPGQNRLDARRLEVVVDGLELFNGAQDTTLVSALRADGTVSRKGATVGGEALRRARARKERTYPELAGEGGRARLVVLAAEVGGRWSNEASQFVRSLAWAKAQSAPESTQTQVAHAWNRRWRKILACTAAKSFANTLLEHASPTAAGGTKPSEAHMMRDCAHEW